MFEWYRSYSFISFSPKTSKRKKLYQFEAMEKCVKELLAIQIYGFLLKFNWTNLQKMADIVNNNGYYKRYSINYIRWIILDCTSSSKVDFPTNSIQGGDNHHFYKVRKSNWYFKGVHRANLIPQYIQDSNLHMVSHEL